MVKVTMPDGKVYNAVTIDERLWRDLPTIRLFSTPVSTNEIVAGSATPAHIFINATVDYAVDYKTATIRNL